MFMIRKENQSIFQYIGINLIENDSKITIDQINYAENLKPLNHIVLHRKIIMDEQQNKTRHCI